MSAACVIWRGRPRIGFAYWAESGFSISTRKFGRLLITHETSFKRQASEMCGVGTSQLMYTSVEDTSMTHDAVSCRSQCCVRNGHALKESVVESEIFREKKRFTTSYYTYRFLSVNKLASSTYLYFSEYNSLNTWLNSIFMCLGWTRSFFLCHVSWPIFRKSLNTTRPHFYHYARTFMVHAKVPSARIYLWYDMIWWHDITLTLHRFRSAVRYYAGRLWAQKNGRLLLLGGHYNSLFRQQNS